MKSVTLVYHEGPGYSRETERAVLLPDEIDVRGILDSIGALGLTPLSIRPPQQKRSLFDPKGKYSITDRYKTEGRIKDGDIYSVFTSRQEETARRIERL